MTDAQPYELLYAVLHEAEAKVEATLLCPGGRVRKITYRWSTRTPTPLPLQWLQSVIAEAEYQRAEELRGRLPF